MPQVVTGQSEEGSASTHRLLKGGFYLRFGQFRRDNAALIGFSLFMQGEVKERWLELCERAANERDPYVQVRREMVRLLDQKTNRIKNSLSSVACWLCGKSVSLENCKTEERGRAVHEERYVTSFKADSR